MVVVNNISGIYANERIVLGCKVRNGTVHSLGIGATIVVAVSYDATEARIEMLPAVLVLESVAFRSLVVRLPNAGYNSYEDLVVEVVIGCFLLVKAVDQPPIRSSEIVIFKRIASTLTYPKGSLEGRKVIDIVSLNFPSVPA